MLCSLEVVIVSFHTVFIEKKCLELPSRFNLLSFMSVTERGVVLTRDLGLTFQIVRVRTMKTQ
jgi:hypothetical protein